MKSRIVKDEVVYTGKICRVHKINLEMAPGQVVDRDLVELSDAVVIVPVLADSSVVMIRNERFAVGQDLLEFPAGKIDGDEDPHACAARELAEETGYSAGSLIRLGGFYTSPGAITEYIHAFLATNLVEGEQNLEAHERINVEIVGYSQLVEMIRSGELHDAKSIAAWALWRVYEGR